MQVSVSQGQGAERGREVPGLPGEAPPSSSVQAAITEYHRLGY